jgi:hypothetical protein
MRISTRLVVAGLMSVLALGVVPVGAAAAHQTHTNLVGCCR